jgi:hypothetical protein
MILKLSSRSRTGDSIGDDNNGDGSMRTLLFLDERDVLVEELLKLLASGGLA